MSREVRMILEAELLHLENALKGAEDCEVVIVKSIVLPRERVEKMIQHFRTGNIDPTIIPLGLLAVSPEWRKIQLWLNGQEEIAMTR